MNRLLRIVLSGIIGYFFGYGLAQCCKEANAQVAQNEQVHLNSNNTLIMRGEIDSTLVTYLELKLAKLVIKRGLKDYPIYLVVDSPGGEVYAGQEFIEFAKVIPNLRTITIFGASMAAITVELLPGERLITNNGELMFHRAKAEVGGQVEVGELETRLARIKSSILGMEQIVADRLKLPLFVYKAKIKDEMWLPAKEAVSNNAADKVVDIVCSAELIQFRIQNVIDSMFGQSILQFSGCPSLRNPVDEKDGE
jgi:ATP-dependent protease ClpP protease subunit